MEKHNYIEITETILIDDFKEIIKETEFLNFWFSQEERNSFSTEKQSNSLACRYLAKKIIIEKLSGLFEPGQISILNNKLGKPVLYFNSELKEIEGYTSIQCTLSHSRKTAVAMVVFEKKGN